MINPDEAHSALILYSGAWLPALHETYYYLLCAQPQARHWSCGVFAFQGISLVKGRATDNIWKVFR